MGEGGPPRWRSFTIRIPTDANRHLGLGVSSRNGRVYVTSVDPTGLGALVGVNVFDRISRVNCVKVTTKWECEEALEKCSRCSDAVTLDMRRRKMAAQASPNAKKTVQEKPLLPETFAKDKHVSLTKSMDYMVYCSAGDESLKIGNPMHGISKPIAPDDIRHILQSKTKSIIHDFKTKEAGTYWSDQLPIFRRIFAKPQRNRSDDLQSAKETTSLTDARLVKIGEATSTALMMDANEKLVEEDDELSESSRTHLLTLLRDHSNESSPETSSRRSRRSQRQKKRRGTKTVIIDKEIEYDHIGTDIKTSAREMKLP